MTGASREAVLGHLHQVQQKEEATKPKGSAFDRLLQDWQKSFRGLKFPGRGKHPWRDMLGVAMDDPKYLVFSYEKGQDHFGIPQRLYEICADAVVHGLTLRNLALVRSLGAPASPELADHLGKLAHRLHHYKDPRPGQMVITSCERPFDRVITARDGNSIVERTSPAIRHVLVDGQPLDYAPLVSWSEAVVYPNCRSAMDMPLEPYRPECPAKPEEPSFLDSAQCDSPDIGSFLDGLF